MNYYFNITRILFHLTFSNLANNANAQRYSFLGSKIAVNTKNNLLYPSIFLLQNAIFLPLREGTVLPDDMVIYHYLLHLAG